MFGLVMFMSLPFPATAADEIDGGDFEGEHDGARSSLICQWNLAKCFDGYSRDPSVDRQSDQAPNFEQMDVN